MEELSFLDKIKILFDNILAHPFFTLLFFVPLIVFFLQKKHGKKVYVILYFMIIFSILIFFGDVIFKLFDNLMDGLFMVLYFPNFITLFAVVVLSSLFALISLFSKNMHKINKAINYISFGIIQLLFVLILVAVRVNKINIYKDNALYTNSDVLSLMQLLIGLFVLQIVSVLIINGINKVTNMLNKKDEKLAQSINEQAMNLHKKKKLIKNIQINNEKVGFINVADTTKTSKPRLKPFKFDINKLESIRLDDKINQKPKLFNFISLNDKAVSYLNEVIKPRKFKPVELDSNKIQSIRLNGKTSRDRSFNYISLKAKAVSYLNEVIKPRKFRPVELDSNKIQSIKLNGIIKKSKLFNKVSLTNKNFTYLNEVIKPRKFKPVELDSNKIQSIRLNGKTSDSKLFNYRTLEDKPTSYLNEIIKSHKFKPLVLDLDKVHNIKLNGNISKKKLYSEVSLINKDFTYLNEIVKPRKFKSIKLDSSKIQSIKLNNTLDRNSKKGFSTILLDTNKPIYLSLDFNNNYEDEFDKILSIKPDLMKKMNDSSNILNSKEKNKFINKKDVKVISPIIYKVRKKDISNNLNSVDSKKLISNLNIIDIQSTLDVVSKCHLMKEVKLKGFDNILTIDNLKITNFKLLTDILKIYKLYKKL